MNSSIWPAHAALHLGLLPVRGRLRLLVQRALVALDVADLLHQIGDDAVLLREPLGAEARPRSDRASCAGPPDRCPARPAPSPGRRRCPSRASRPACAPASATFLRSGMFRHSSGTSLRAFTAAIFCASSARRARSSRASRSSCRRSAGSFVFWYRSRRSRSRWWASVSSLPSAARSSRRCRPIRSSSSSTSFSSSVTWRGDIARSRARSPARRLAFQRRQHLRLVAQHMLQAIGDAGQRGAQRLAQRAVAPILVDQLPEQRQVRFLRVVRRSRSRRAPRRRRHRRSCSSRCARSPISFSSRSR